VTPIQTAQRVYADAVARHGEDEVTAYVLSETYESMLRMDQRLAGGVFYTPEGVARPMSRWAVEAALRGVGPSPGDVLRVVLLDPACGCGVVLFEAAHVLAAMYAQRLTGGYDGHLVAALMPRVILECVFGMDIDPVAVELTRLGLALATGWTLRPEMLSRHIVCANTLEGPDGPPALEDRRRRLVGPDCAGSAAHSTSEGSR
jgi:N-6 DNA Methylase